jgi:threonine dehydrogenase-like Zn-dependent dehydrogenase
VRAAVLLAPHEVQIRDVPPAPPRGAVRVRVAAAGVCGSDVHAYAGHNPFLRYPRVLGHEIAGTVDDVEGVADADARAGADGVALHPERRVVVSPFVSCGACRTCRRGFPNLCPHLLVTGVHADGGFAEYVWVTPQQVYTLPPALDLAAAALVEPFSIGAEAMAAGGVAAGDRVLVIGAGPIGLTCVALAAARGALTLAIDRVPARLATAAALGAAAVCEAGQDVEVFMRWHTGGLGADVVIEAVGTKQTIESALGWVAPGGVCVLLGLYDGTVDLPAAACLRKGLRLVATRLNRGRFPDAIEFVARHPQVAALASHEVPLAELPETLAAMAAGTFDGCKAIVRP